MSKELIERLRMNSRRTSYRPGVDELILEAADRIKELERDLLNLVCRIHRDGGHYIAKYGEAKAIADADTVAAQNNADLDALQADNARLRAAFETLWLGTNPNEWDGKAVELFEAALSPAPKSAPCRVPEQGDRSVCK